LGLARLASVGQPDNPFAEAVVVRLNAGGVDRAVGPTFIEGLLRPPVRISSADGPAYASELQDDRHETGGSLGYGKVGLNRDPDLWKTAVVDVAVQRLGYRRDPAAFAFRGADDVPFHLRHVRRDPAVNFTLKIFHDFRAPLRPLIRARCFRPILECHQVGHGCLVWIGSCFVGGIPYPCIPSVPHLLDAELVEHVLIVVVTGSDVAGTGILIALHALARC
jgi:hypothetical protein